MIDSFDDITQAIGRTPLVRLNRIGRETGATLYAKLEYTNPGHSVKDRIAVQIIDDAEREGALKPGGTIIECTSGNTGMGLAMVGAARGYRTTGPEIWEQTEGRVDAVVIATGTGGTLTGIARYVKERKPEVKFVLIDPVGSILYDYFKTKQIISSFKTYKVEGFGEDFLPTTLDFAFVDECYQVTDKECFLTARELTRKEGLFSGGSAGGAVCGAIKFAKEYPQCRTIVVILPD